jgi:hypothetical protein
MKGSALIRTDCRASLAMTALFIIFCHCPERDALRHEDPGMDGLSAVRLFAAFLYFHARPVLLHYLDDLLELLALGNLQHLE